MRAGCAANCTREELVGDLVWDGRGGAWFFVQGNLTVNGTSDASVKPTAERLIMFRGAVSTFSDLARSEVVVIGAWTAGEAGGQIIALEELSASLRQSSSSPFRSRSSAKLQATHQQQMVPDWAEHRTNDAKRKSDEMATWRAARGTRDRTKGRRSAHGHASIKSVSEQASEEQGGQSMALLVFRVIVPSQERAVDLAQKLHDWIRRGELSEELQKLGWPVVAASSGGPPLALSASGEVLSVPVDSQLEVSINGIEIRTLALSAGAAACVLLILGCAIYFLWRRQVQNAERKAEEKKAALMAVPLRAALDVQRVFRGHLGRNTMRSLIFDMMRDLEDGYDDFDISFDEDEQLLVEVAPEGWDVRSEGTDVGGYAQRMGLKMAASGNGRGVGFGKHVGDSASPSEAGMSEGLAARGSASAPSVSSNRQVSAGRGTGRGRGAPNPKGSPPAPSPAFFGKMDTGSAGTGTGFISANVNRPDIERISNGQVMIRLQPELQVTVKCVRGRK